MTNKCVSFFAVHLDSICFAHTSCLQKKMIALSARVMVGSKWRKKKKSPHRKDKIYLAYTIESLLYLFLLFFTYEL